MSLFDPALVLVGSYVVPSSSAGTFFGVIDDVNELARINLFDATGATAEGGDNQEWGPLLPPVEL